MTSHTDATCATGDVNEVMYIVAMVVVGFVATITTAAATALVARERDAAEAKLKAVELELEELKAATGRATRRVAVTPAVATGCSTAKVGSALPHTFLLSC